MKSKINNILFSGVNSKESFPEMLDHIKHFKRNVIWELPGNNEYHMHYLCQRDAFRFIMYDPAGDDIGCTMYANGADWVVPQHEFDLLLDITDETLFKQVTNFIIENKIIDAKVIIENEMAHIYAQHGCICRTDDMQVIQKTLLRGKK